MEQAEILRRILTELNYLKETTMVLVEGQQKLDVKIDIVKPNDYDILWHT